MEIQLNIFEILKMILKRWIAILLTVIVFSLGTYLLTEFAMTKLYYSRGSLYVDSAADKKSNDVIYQDLITSKELIFTYIEVLKSDKFMELIAKESGLDYTGTQLKSMITMKALNDTEILEVSVKTPDPKKSQKIIQTVLENANDEMSRIFQGGNVFVVDSASYSETSVYPTLRKNILIGAILGFLISALIVVCLELFDTRLKTPADCETFKIPILGEIPNMEQMH